MASREVKRFPRLTQLWILLSILLLGVGYGCQSQEPPLSPAAARFKEEVRECLALLVKPLVEPVSQKNKAAIIETLKKSEPENLKLCQFCPFRMGVLDNHGNTLAVYPPTQGMSLDFYRYGVVQEALNSHRISKQRLFLANGSGLYVICVPLLKDGQVIGVLAIALSASEAGSKWGLTEKEFAAMNFNR